MARIARTAKCSVGHVSRVYHGERTSKLVELLIAQEINAAQPATGE